MHLEHEVLQSGALERHPLRGAPGGEGEHAQGVASGCHDVAVWFDEKKKAEGKSRRCATNVDT